MLGKLFPTRYIPVVSRPEGLRAIVTCAVLWGFSQWEVSVTRRSQLSPGHIYLPLTQPSQHTSLRTTHHRDITCQTVFPTHQTFNSKKKSYFSALNEWNVNVREFHYPRPSWDRHRSGMNVCATGGQFLCMTDTPAHTALAPSAPAGVLERPNNHIHQPSTH